MRIAEVLRSKAASLQAKIDRHMDDENERVRRDGITLKTVQSVMLRAAELHDAGKCPRSIAAWKDVTKFENAVRVVRTAERHSEDLAALTDEQQEIWKLMDLSVGPYTRGEAQEMVSSATAKPTFTKQVASISPEGSALLEQAEAATDCLEYALIDNGRVVMRGTPRQIIPEADRLRRQHPAHKVTTELVYTLDEAVAVIVEDSNLTEDGARRVLDKRYRPIDYGEQPLRYLISDIMDIQKHYPTATNATDAPPIAGAADQEYKTRIAADQVTAEFATKSARRLDSGRKSFEDSPLMGGERQMSLW